MDKITYGSIAVTILGEGCAGVAYFLTGDWRRGVIWIAYAIATLMITL